MTETKSRAVCAECGRITGTTLRTRDVPMRSGLCTVHGIEAYVCDVCDSVVAIPPSATPAIRAAREAALAEFPQG